MSNCSFGFQNNNESSPKTPKELLEALEEARNTDWVKEIREELEASERIDQEDLNFRVR